MIAGWLDPVVSSGWRTAPSKTHATAGWSDVVGSSECPAVRCALLGCKMMAACTAFDHALPPRRLVRSLLAPRAWKAIDEPTLPLRAMGAAPMC